MLGKLLRFARYLRAGEKGERGSLADAAIAYAHERPCDACGDMMLIQRGIVVTWKDGTMTAKHLTCALPL